MASAMLKPDWSDANAHTCIDVPLYLDKMKKKAEVLSEKVYQPCETILSRQKASFKSSVAQFYAAFVECILLVELGMMYIMPSIVVGALHNVKDDPMSLSDEMASWIGSVLNLCQPIGSVLSGFISERYGRRGGMLLVNIPFLLGWFLLYQASSVQGLCVATLTMGVGIGFCEAPIMAYIGEISEPRLRGILLNLTAAAANLGCSLEQLFGSLVDWRTAALISMSGPVLSFLTLTTVPESPTWLVTKGKLEKAQRSLGWLRGFQEPHMVQEEFNELVRYSKKSSQLRHSSLLDKYSSDEHAPLDKKIDLEKNGYDEERTGNWLRTLYIEISNPGFYLPLRFIIISFFFTQCTSLQPFKAYLVEILRQFAFPVDSKWIFVMTGAQAFLGSVVAIFVITFTGKRQLLLYSQLLTSLSILGIGVYSKYCTGPEYLNLSWVLITLLSVCFFFGCLGVSNIPWILAAEIFPVRGRGMATGISAAWCYLVTFITTKIFLVMQSYLEISGMFFFYAVVGIFGFIYFYFYMPETEGKTLEQIETYFTPHHDPKEKFSKVKRPIEPKTLNSMTS